MPWKVTPGSDTRSSKDAEARGELGRAHPTSTSKAGSLKEVAEWTERYRRFWEESYDRLDKYLDELQGRGKEEGDGRAEAIGSSR